METNNTFLSTLQEKEKELDKQLTALRTTIQIFQNGQFSPNGSEAKVATNSIPKTYAEAITWNAKVLFALSKIESGFVQDIVDEMYKHSQEIDKAALFTRVTALASSLKTKKILGGKAYGNKYKYYIK